MNCKALVQLLLITSIVEAGKWVQYKNDYYVAMGCKYAVDQAVDFCGKAEALKTYKCACKNKYALASWVDCANQFTDLASLEKTENQIIDICSEKAKVHDLTINYLNENYINLKNTTVEYTQTMNITEPKHIVAGPKINKRAENEIRSYQNRWNNVNTSHYMGIAFVSAVCLVMIAAGLVNWSKRISAQISNSNGNRLTRFFRKNLTLGLMGENHLHLNKLNGVNPDRLEALLIASMFLYSILCCTIMGFSYFEGDPTFKTYQAGTSRYYGDRSAIMFSYQLPLLFIFPGRNNFFQVITRWKYNRFITFHKWLARIVLLEIFIHAFAMSSQTYSLALFSRFGKDWYRYGITSCVCAGIIVISANGFIRRRFYDLFICVHVVLVTMFLWTAWKHAHSQDYQNFYWACAAIWAFDRVVRIGRIISYGGPKMADIELFPGEDVLKITVEKSKLVNYHPGSHAFINFLDPLRFWQSHPFTVYPCESNPNAINFTCRVKKGITKFLADKCRVNPDNKIQMKICVDGFYGEQSEYQFYDKAVFITGGTGIAGPYYHVKQLAENNVQKEIKLYWSVRTYECIRWFLPELISLKNTQVKPVIFVSKPEHHNSSSSDSEGKTEVKESTCSSDILEALESFAEIKPGRLNVPEIIRDEIESSNGTIAFGSCAHTQVVDEVRKQVANVLDLHQHKIEYFEEMQGW